ncbi:hypothetical protein BKA62DRAFT_834265 [Auriculariales sp. MPI-PUGE-AT-0066]|nr:hypothetical protein BKA62DRAFT_834265 [Auriculariales sp. MPI-PUGE-AT-0066]
MSSNSASAAVGAGIIPSRDDFVPSIVFIVLYAPLIPLVIWRWLKRETRCTALIEPSIFLAVRIASLGLRVHLSKHRPTAGIIAAESVLMTAATVLIAGSIIGQVRNLLKAWGPKPSNDGGPSAKLSPSQRALANIALLMRLGLLASLAMSVYSGTQTSGAMHGETDKLATLAKLRKGSSLVIFIVILLALAAVALLNTRHGLPRRPTLFLGTTSTLLLVTAIYRVQSAFRITASNTTTALWCASIAPEYVVAVAILIVNLKTLVPEKPEDKLAGGDAEMVGLASTDTR